MKTKILKKLIAALCAATMSMAVVAPAGAIQYTGKTELEQNQTDALNSINEFIQESQKALQEIKKHYSNMKKEEYVSLISSIENNLTKLNNQNVSDKSFLTGMLLTRVQKIYGFIQGMEHFAKIKNDDNVKEYVKEEINPEIELLLKLNDEKNQVSKLKKAVDDKNTEMMKLIGRVETLDPSFKKEKNGFTNKACSSVEKLRDAYADKFETQLKTAINDLDDAISHLKKLNVNLQNKPSEELNSKLQNRPTEDPKIKLNNKRKELTNKKIELYQQFKDTNVIAEHNLCDTYPISNIEGNFVKDWCKLINVELSQENFDSDWHKSDLSELSEEDIQKRIELIDNTIKSLKQVALQVNFAVVVPNELSSLKREFSTKKREIDRLLKCAGIDGICAPKVKENLEFTKNTDLKNINSLRTAIPMLDTVIASLTRFDDGKKAAFQQWQEQAHKEIDELLKKATEKMKDSSNKTTVEDLKKEIEPLLCGTQTMANCWLYSICNAMNILNHFENDDKGIIQNSRFLSWFTKYNCVEKFFIKNANLSKKEVSEGGINDDKSRILSELRINHVNVNLKIDNIDEVSLEKNMNIVKTLLLTHFAKSKLPVLIGVKYDEDPFDSENRMGSLHAMVIVGVDINTNSVVVADSNYEKLQVYSLDRIALAICNHGITDFCDQSIQMIFPSLINTDNFTYDNKDFYHSWDKFKSKLLPAISK